MSYYTNFKFDILSQASDSQARLGLLTTPHGIVETPNFIFCATKAAIKGLTPQQMRDCGTQIILSNTYHLMLQPSGAIVEKMGGLQKFTGWQGPMFTDSGGFQIFSLGHGSVAQEIKGKRKNNRPKTLLKINENGAEFRSYIDGSLHTLTPEKSIDIQRQLGADLIVVLDECTPFHVDKAYTEQSMHLSHRWASRSLQQFQKHDNGRQALYGIVQGGIYPDLRQQAADFLNDQDFFAHAIGGSLGATKPQMQDVVAITMQKLRRDRIVHLLGIGGVQDIFHGVKQGIDTFDCVHPTRLARHGGALVKATHWSRYDGGGREFISLKNAQYREDSRPIDEQCPCATCRNFSRAYIHHLYKARELLAMHILTIHNVTFMNNLMKDIRIALLNKTLDQCEEEWVVQI